MMCECYQIGGRFIAEDPDCPAHGTEARQRREEYDEAIADMREMLSAERERCARLRGLLDGVRLTVPAEAINENLRRNIQMALHDALSVGPNP